MRWSDVVPVVLAINGVFGGFVVVNTVWQIVGSPLLDARFEYRISKKIRRLRGSNISSFHVFGSSVKQSLVFGLSFRPWSAFKTNDTEWARNIQTKAKNLPDEKSLTTSFAIAQIVQAAIPPEKRVDLAALAARNLHLLERLVAYDIERATTITQLRSAHSRYRKLRNQIVFRTIHQDSAMKATASELLKLLDYAGRGSAAGLLLGLVFFRDWPSGGSALSIVGITGGIVGAVFYNHGFLKKISPTLPAPKHQLDIFSRRHPAVFLLLFSIIFTVLTATVWQFSWQFFSQQPSP